MLVQVAAENDAGFRWKTLVLTAAEVATDPREASNS